MKGLVHLWSTWGIQIMVLASFTLQLWLLICGGIRRRSSSMVLRASLWLAYLMADSTAIYALGHLSIISRSSEHQLVAFWAPFLLLHLGGPDNITAFALEDNSLWLRHLQTLVVQVLGAAYVINKYMSSGGILLLLASISMFVAGLVKYGERIWALKCGGMSSIRDRFNKWGVTGRVKPYRFVVEGKSEEEILLEAHYSFAACMCVFLDVTLEEAQIEGLHAIDPGYSFGEVVVGEDIYKLLELELSLMYDILYTKAAVMHTWYGFCIHLTSLLGTAAAFLLFQLSIRGGRADYNTADVIISYVLLVGALVLETISVCRAVFSSWTCSFFHRNTQRDSTDSGTLALAKWLLHVLVSVRRPVKPASRRLWRDSLGQYNLLHLCYRDTTEPWSRLTTKMGLGEWWNRSHFQGTFSGTDSLSTSDLRNLVLQALPPPETADLNSRGRMMLEKFEAYKDFARWSVSIDFHQSILVWHMVTDLFIEVYDAGHESKLVEATRVLSNYMMFLLVVKPDMLPGRAHHNLYLDVSNNFEAFWPVKDSTVMGSPRSWNLCHMIKELFQHEGPTNFSRTPQRKKIAEKLFNSFESYSTESIDPGIDPRRGRFRMTGNSCAALLAKELRDLGRSDTLELIFGVWVEVMIYAAEHCSRDSHARHLSSGGEFITIVWLLVHHLMQAARYNKYVRNPHA